MIKRVAANWVKTGDTLSHDAMIELHDGVVTDIVPLSSLKAEPAGTIFLNGTLSGENGSPLSVGYHGNLEINNTTIIWH